MTDTIIGQLRDSSWRGIRFPFTGERLFGFLHDQNEHRYIFRDQQLIESLGRQNPTYRYRIPFREGIRQFGWKNLFTVVYPKFLQACLDRSAGELVDSVHGPVRAKLSALQEVLSVDKTDGVDVSADFIFAPEDETDSPTDFVRIAKTITGFQAALFDYEAAGEALTPEQKAEVERFNPKNTQPKLNPLEIGRQVAGTAQQYKQRTRAQIGYVADQIQRAQQDIEQARDPELEPLRRDSARLIRSSRELDATLARPPSPFRTVALPYPIGRVAFASKFQVRIDAMVAFNPGIEDLIIIPAHRQIRIPRKDG